MDGHKQRDYIDDLIKCVIRERKHRGHRSCQKYWINTKNEWNTTYMCIGYIAYEQIQVYILFIDSTHSFSIFTLTVSGWILIIIIMIIICNFIQAKKNQLICLWNRDLRDLEYVSIWCGWIKSCLFIWMWIGTQKVPNGMVCVNWRTFFGMIPPAKVYESHVIRFQLLKSMRPKLHRCVWCASMARL